MLAPFMLFAAYCRLDRETDLAVLAAPSFTAGFALVVVSVFPVFAACTARVEAALCRRRHPRSNWLLTQVYAAHLRIDQQVCRSGACAPHCRACI